MSNEWNVVIGRVTPMGQPTTWWDKRNRTPKKTAKLIAGRPLCQYVKLERIVNPAKEQAEKEFLALTDGL